MTQPTASLQDAAPPPVAHPGGSRWRSRAAWLAATLAAAGAAWHGGPAGAAVVVTLSLAALWRAAPGQAAAESDAAPQPVPGSRVGAEVMVSQVVPVWSRQMDVTREAATEGLGKLLENFSAVSGALGQLSDQLEHFSPTASAGSIDEAIDQQSAALGALLAPSERAFAQRDEMLTVLRRCSDALIELQQQAKQAHEISRHTRLVAFNASIEAQRHAGGASGSQAVANELRVLAGRMAATGEAVHGLVTQLSQALAAARLGADLDDTRPDELRLELQIRAREALRALLGSLGTSIGGGRELQEASATLRMQLDEAFVNFQFGDRVSQMLNIVGNDMVNFARWVERHPHATQTDAAEWLEALEASYTMEEQRAHHHGNVHIDRGSEIEFF